MFKVTFEELEYEDAKEACAANDGHLAVVTSEDRNDLIGKLVR